MMNQQQVAQQQQQQVVDTVIIGGGQAGLAMCRCLLMDWTPSKKKKHKPNKHNDDDVINDVVNNVGSSVVVLERGKIGERWRSNYWDSLYLLTPKWQSRLPGGFGYNSSYYQESKKQRQQQKQARNYDNDNDNIDGFMTKQEFIHYLETYADSFQAPIHTNTTVVRLEEEEEEEEQEERKDGKRIKIRFRVTTQNGCIWQCKNVVISTGYCDLPKIPSFVPTRDDEDDEDDDYVVVRHIPATEYKNPSQVIINDNNNNAETTMTTTGTKQQQKKRKQILLVVGAGASGIQIAQELAQEATTINNKNSNSNSNNIQVVISVGRHCRWPRSYRGKDILWWMDRMNVFQQPANQIDEANCPGPQLMGHGGGCPSGRRGGARNNDNDNNHNHDDDANLYNLHHKYGVTIVGKVTNITKERIEFDNDDESLGKTIQQADDDCIELLRKIDSFIEKNKLNPTNTPGLITIIPTIPTPPTTTTTTTNNNNINSSYHDEICPRLPYNNCVNNNNKSKELLLSGIDLNKNRKKHHDDAPEDTTTATTIICKVTVIWATGFVREYPFLSDNLKRKYWDPKRYILKNHHGGIVTKGLYVLGYRWQRRKGSNFIDGVGIDAFELAKLIVEEEEETEVEEEEPAADEETM